MNQWKLWISCSVVALLAAVAIVRAQSAPAGDFVLASNAAQRATLASAIATATSTLPRAERNMWRAQLEEMTRPSAQISVKREGLESAVVAGAGVELRSPTDATDVALESDWQLSQRIVAGVLEQTLDNGSISQVYRYAVSRSGAQLTLQATITAPQLFAPIVYTLGYVRQ